MPKVRFATMVEDDQAKTFEETTARLGISPSDALRLFILAFNERGGFPYEANAHTPSAIEAFEDERGATIFASSLAMEALRGTR